VKRSIVLCWGTIALTACLGDPVGPRGSLHVATEGVSADSTLLGEPGKALPDRLLFRVVDDGGRGVPGAQVTWEVSGAGARVAGSSNTDATGRLSADWILGTRASEAQQLSVAVTIGSRQASLSLHAIAVPDSVASLDLGRDSVVLRLADHVALSAAAIDPYGNRFPPPGVQFQSLDTSVAIVDQGGSVRPTKRGLGHIVATSRGKSDTVVVHVIQVVQAVHISPDTLRFGALGQKRDLVVDVRDDQGLSVADTIPAVAVGDSQIVLPIGVAAGGDTVALKSVENGATVTRLAVGSVGTTLPVIVHQEPAQVSVAPDSILFDALGDTARLRVVVNDSLGKQFVNPPLAFSTSDTTILSVATDGRLTSVANGSAWVRVRSNSVSDSAVARIAQVATGVVASQDTLRFTALHAVQATGARATDRLGATVAGAVVSYASADSTIARVTSTGFVEALHNGTTNITAQANGQSKSITVTVAQRPERVLLPSDSIRFVALGETQSVVGIAVDSLGYPVSSRVDSLRIVDTTIVATIDSQTIRARGNGATSARFVVAGLTTHVGIAVQQVPDTVVVHLPPSDSLLNPMPSQVFSLNCTALDRNGYPITTRPALTSLRGLLQGGTCDSVTAVHSGIDTVIVTAGSHSTRGTVAVAVRGVATSNAGQPLVVDSLPAGTFPWAPTAHRSADGTLELFFTAYRQDTVYQVPRGDLQRLVSSDGISFRYDGVALQHDSVACSLNGQGVEDVAIIQRNDGPGWRMFFASGGAKCYGWQVFSAVSTDGRNWTKEPGVRLGNGGTVPPAPSVTAPWPVGEGMWIEQLPGGQYRMIVGSFEHVMPPPINTWQIAIWYSNDQLNWSYDQTVLTTGGMPSDGQGSVYGPAVIEFAPEVYRMIFTADNRNTGSFHSQLWSAVSTDRQHWQVEGVILGALGTDLYYPSLVGNQVFFLRKDAGAPLGLASAQLLMP